MIHEKLPETGQDYVMYFKICNFTRTSPFKLRLVDRRQLHHSPISCYYDMQIPLFYLSYRSTQIIIRHFKFAQLYRVIKNDCRGFNNLSYTIHLRQEYVYFFI